MNEEKKAEVKNKERQVYELGYHLVSTISSENVEKEAEKIRAFITARGGDFIAEGTPENVSLAYPMIIRDGGKRTKYERAYFGWIKFYMDQESARLLQEEDFSGNVNVLRARLLKTVREDTRAQIQTIDAGVLREVKTTGIIERRPDKIEEAKRGEEVSEAELEKSIDEIIGEKK